MLFLSILISCCNFFQLVRECSNPTLRKITLKIIFIGPVMGDVDRSETEVLRKENIRTKCDGIDFVVSRNKQKMKKMGG